MSEKLVLDSFALVSLFHKEPGWEKVRAVLYEQQRAGTKAFLNWVNWGEFFYIVKRKVGAARAAEALHLLEQLPIELEAVDVPLVREAGRSRASMQSPMRTPFVSPRLAACRPQS